MYLLNRCGDDWRISAVLRFTFHYVSIKSVKSAWANLLIGNLHSTMYLLNRTAKFLCQFWFWHLHSTMYLLNPIATITSKVLNTDLHSTMYLLNQWDRKGGAGDRSHLHSTMYLLNLTTTAPITTVQKHLHSTMYLLNHNQRRHLCCCTFIYIPLCIY